MVREVTGTPLSCGWDSPESVLLRDLVGYAALRSAAAALEATLGAPGLKTLASAGADPKSEPCAF